jgi:hypothetical protein
MTPRGSHACSVMDALFFYSRASASSAHALRPPGARRLLPGACCCGGGAASSHGSRIRLDLLFAAALQAYADDACGEVPRGVRHFRIPSLAQVAA